ncbi:MAG: hypothetical protein LH609_01860 [Rudanella sp.]|nr:hypothetical protein [Rudanella sp.]
MNATLADLKVTDKPVVLVFNKMDQFVPKEEWAPEYDEEGDEPIAVAMRRKTALQYLKKTYLTKKADNVVFISAQTRENFTELRELVYKLVRELHVKIYPNWLDIPLTDYVEEGDGFGLDMPAENPVTA